MRLIDADALCRLARNSKYGVVDWKDIIRMPTVGAITVVQGEWIPQGSVDAEGNQYYTCSVCQCGEVHFPSVKVSFCWNCGAKMDLMQSNDSNVLEALDEKEQGDEQID